MIIHSIKVILQWRSPTTRLMAIRQLREGYDKSTQMVGQKEEVAAFPNNKSRTFDVGFQSLVEQ